jgi:cell division protein FtsQ
MVIKKTIVNWMLTTLWIAIGAGVIALLVAAIKKKDAQHCSAINITIEGVNNNLFVDKKDILNSITNAVGGNPVGNATSAFNLRKLETELEKDIWVKKAQLFFDNNDRLMVHVLEREPLARVFTTGGTTFYIDSSLMMLPLSEKFSARLPVFTSFPSDKIVLSKPDSALLKDILTVSMAIQKDSFSMAIIDQVDITAQRNFAMIPKIGNNIIVFGDATDVEEKLNRLQLFYKKVMVKAGWSNYSVINVQFKGQIVAKRKGAEDKSADSLRTLQLMQAIVENAERQTSDSLHQIAQDNENNSTNADLVQQSIQRDDEHEPVVNEKPQQAANQVTTSPVVAKKTTVTVPKIVAPSAKKTVTIKPVNTAKPAVSNVKPAIKPTIKSTPTNTMQPKAVMPKPATKQDVKKANNEY